MNQKKNLTHAAALLFAATLAGSLQAQSTQEAQATTGTQEDIVTMDAFSVNQSADTGYKAANSVSATRVAVPISSLPMNLTAFTQDFISDQKAYDLYDVIKWAPGVHQDNISQTGWARYNMRGFTSSAVQRDGFSSFRFIDTTNIARVEVIKGPASLLYGQINPGGVINYITKKPEAKASTSLETDIGSNGYSKVMGDSTGAVPGTGGKLLYRVVGMYENIQEFEVIGSGTKQMFAPSLTWKPIPEVTLSVSYENFKRNERDAQTSVVVAFVNGTGTRPYQGLPRDFSFAGEGDFMQFFNQALNVDLTARLGDHLQLRVQYEASDYNQRWRATGQGGTGLLSQTVINYFYPNGTLTSADAMYRRNRYELQEGNERAGQAELVGDYTVGGVKLRPLVGYKKLFGSYYHGKQYNNTTNVASPYYLKPWDLRDPSTWDRSVPFGIDKLIMAANTSSLSDGQSYYAVLSAGLFDDKLNILGGYAHHETHNSPSWNYITNAKTSSDVYRDANVPQVGALYKLTKELGAFVSYSESFVANSSMLTVKNVPTTPAEPSLGKGKEAGLKFDLFNGKLSGTFSIYEMTVNPTGIITITDGTAPDGTTYFTQIQGGSQKSTGQELDLLYTPMDGLQFMASFSHCNARYVQHPTNSSYNGTRLVGTPDDMLNLWSKYSFRDGVLKGAYIGGGFNYVGVTTHQGANPTVLMPGYTTWDISLGYNFKACNRPWKVDLLIKNVFDKLYYASASSMGNPRHAVLSLSTKF